MEHIHSFFFFPGSGKLETEVCQNTKDKMSYENKNNNSKKKKKNAGRSGYHPPFPSSISIVHIDALKDTSIKNLTIHTDLVNYLRYWFWYWLPSLQFDLI